MVTAVVLVLLVAVGLFWIWPHADEPGWTRAGFTANGIPTEGQVLVGAAVEGEVATFEAAIGGSLDVHRSYFRADQVERALAVAKDDLSNGRLPWLSFKLPTDWEEAAMGAADPWAGEIARALGGLDGPVWLAFHHEPEGDGELALWLDIQTRFSVIFAAEPNLAYSVVYGGWAQLRTDDYLVSMQRYWPERAQVDIVAFDLYNWYATSNPRSGKVSYEWTELDFYYERIEQWLQASGNDHVSWAIAETGYTDAAADVPRGGPAPTGRPVSSRGSGADWLTRSYEDMVRRGGVALSYFDVSPSLNDEPEDWTWPILTEPKVGVFTKLLERSSGIAD